jgi:hypothetical protein
MRTCGFYCKKGGQLSFAHVPVTYQEGGHGATLTSEVEDEWQRKQE